MDIKSLQDEQNKISKKIRKLKDAKEKELLAEYQKYVGKCFKYPNSDGEKRFPTYMQVLKVNSVWVNDKMETYNINVTILEFDGGTHQQERIIIDKYATLNMWLDYPISLSEFQKAYQKAIAKFALLNERG